MTTPFANEPIVVSVEMGYGHLRAALPLAQALDTEVMYADREPLADREERRLWAWVQRGHELLSRPPSLAAVLGKSNRWMERVTAIPPLYWGDKLAEPNLGARVLAALAERGLGRGLVRYLERTGAPLVTTFYVPAIIADRAGHPHVYCVVTDADVNRVWAPLADRPSNLHYFAPSLRVVRRLQAYGVPRERITMTGFPLPLELLGGSELTALHRSLARRLVRLDPSGLFRELYRHDLERVFGALPAQEEGRPPELMFAVGGAGAQAEMAYEFLPSLKLPIESGRLRLTLVAGVRADVATTFERALVRSRLASRIGNGIRVIRTRDFDGYYRAFNAALTEADILWTKPSELSFYAGLGIPLVLAKPVGSHERFNRRWLREQGVGLKQDDLRHAWHWLDEWIKDGTLAASAWMGYVRLPKDGTHRIASEVHGQSSSGPAREAHSLQSRLEA